MSWWITLDDPETELPAKVDQFEEGGTYPLGGTDDAELYVTYNYGELFDFHWLDGKKASDTITKLQDAVTDLGIDKDPDYWLPTPGNVGYACNLLLQWAKQYPDIVWAVS